MAVYMLPSTISFSVMSLAQHKYLLCEVVSVITAEALEAYDANRNPGTEMGGGNEQQENNVETNVNNENNNRNGNRNLNVNNGVLYPLLENVPTKTL
ncbi:hypothetical protein Tco_1503889 [Tanacetum coccineum]